MFCKECGQQLDSTATFCKYCGSPQPSLNSSKQSSVTTEDIISNDITSEGEESFEEQIKIVRKHKIFYTNDEVLIDILGSGFLTSLFVQEEFSKSVLFCSNKRIYQRGKLFYRDFQRHVIYTYGEASVDLREITGIRFYIDNPVHRFKFIGIAVLISFFGLLLSQEIKNSINNYLINIIYIFSGAMFVVAFIATIIYYLKKEKWFSIEYAGGEIIINCNWYPKKRINQFMRNISIQKDKIFESESNQQNNRI